MLHVVHYKEIGIKGGNRVFFERQLGDNVRAALGADAVRRVRRFHGRLLVESEGLEGARAEERLARLPGIAHFAEATLVPLELAAIEGEAVRLSEGVPAASFRIETKRSNKRFPHTSVDVSRAAGAAVAVATGMRVDLERPEHTVWVEITEREALLYARRVAGVGGLPVGVSGTVVALLSGGIDSPVAAFKLLRRGARVVLLHFHNYTRHQEGVKAKIVDLARLLARYQLRSRLWLVPFAEAQEALVAAVPPPLRMVAYRRAMLEIGEGVLERERALAFVTGDSVGQVASQTLENLNAIYAAARHPVLAPLIGDDKDDIVALARRIGTYETSIRPYDDCCSFLVARHPETRARVEVVAAREARIPLAEIGKRALDAAEVLDLEADA